MVVALAAQAVREAALPGVEEALVAREFGRATG
jgi:hypothetical protein